VNLERKNPTAKEKILTESEHCNGKTVQHRPVLFWFGYLTGTVDLRSSTLLSGGLAVSLLVASSCGVSPVQLIPRSQGASVPINRVHKLNNTLHNLLPFSQQELTLLVSVPYAPHLQPKNIHSVFCSFSYLNRNQNGTHSLFLFPFAPRSQPKRHSFLVSVPFHTLTESKRHSFLVSVPFHTSTATKTALILHFCSLLFVVIIQVNFYDAFYNKNQ
jgi:hypothetical protein